MLFSARLSEPTAQDFTIASAEVQAQKALHPGPSRKRKQGDIEDDTVDGTADGMADGTADGGASSGPPRKRRVQGCATESLRLTSKNMLRHNPLIHLRLKTYPGLPYHVLTPSIPAHPHHTSTFNTLWDPNATHTLRQSRIGLTICIQKEALRCFEGISS